MKASRFVWLLLVSALTASAQEGWRTVPIAPLGPNDPKLVGLIGDAVASRGEKKVKARVIVSAAPQWGTVTMGIWIKGISELIEEKELWPYDGPAPGRAASNPRMIAIKVFTSAGELNVDSHMGINSGGNYPKGAAPEDDEVLSVNLKEGELTNLLERMNTGFNYGVVTIGQGVFSPPFVVRFDGKGINGKLNVVLDYVAHSGPSR